jgi:hypothetical protein
VTDDDGVRHRLWAVTEKGPFADRSAVILAAAGRDPITIADGHHRYETAIRYRDERRANKTGETDPASDYVLMLFLETTRQKLTVLPTHRIVRGLGDDGVATFLSRAHELFDVEPVDGRAQLEVRLRQSVDRSPGGEGRFGLWTRQGGAILRARRDAFARFLPPGGAALRRLDVTLLQTALIGCPRSIERRSPRAGWVHEIRARGARLGGPIPRRRRHGVPARSDSGRRDRGRRGDGDVMPQKSTYFYPKGPHRAHHQSARMVNRDGWASRGGI